MKLLTIIRSSRTTAAALRSWLIAMRLAGVALIVIALATAANTVVAGDAFPLDKYPGLGRSPEAARRDDTIAAWEAFRREELIASCMARSGFEYGPAVAFPREALVAVASGLGLADPGSAVTGSPSGQNEAYAAALSVEARERYYRALFGESGADLAAAWRTGRVPEGRGADFARGGCVGAAIAAIPSVWTLKRELEGELDAVRRDIAASAEIAATRARYAECARRAGGIDASGPDVLDRLAASDRSRATAIPLVARECGPVWAAGYRQSEVAALKQFERSNMAVLLAAQERYRDAMATLSIDRGFLAYLARYAWVR